MSAIAETANEIASLTGIYRCTGLGCTFFRNEGEELAPCTCGGRESQHGWEFILQDNIKHDERTMVFVGQGLIVSTVMNDLPAVGEILNLRGPILTGAPLYNGAYIVTNVGVLAQKGEEFFHLFVERIGEIDTSKPICLILALHTC